MSVPDMPPSKPPSSFSVDHSVTRSGSRSARNGDAPAQSTRNGDAPTHEQVVDLARKVKEAIRENAEKAKAAGERVLEGVTPPDGTVVVLRSDSKIVRRLRALRDGLPPSGVGPVPA